MIEQSRGIDASSYHEGLLTGVCVWDLWCAQTQELIADLRRQNAEYDAHIRAR